MWWTLFFVALVFILSYLWVWYLHVGMSPDFDLAVHELREWDREFERLTGKSIQSLLNPPPVQYISTHNLATASSNSAINIMYYC